MTTIATRSEHKHSKNALYGAIFGFFSDMYDVYLPVVALTPAMVYFQSADTPPASAAIFSALIFTASIVGRPLGSLIFGPIGDRIGRRQTTLIAAGGAAVCTLAMCILPGYETLGMGALAILVVLRLFDGIFLGGEYTAANPLALEHAPKNRRGLYGSLINMGFPLALAFITIVTIATLQVMPAGGPQSAYAVWGWRIPFAIGGLLCIALFITYLRAVPESKLWEKETDTDNSFRKLFSGNVRRVFLFACVTVAGVWFSMNGTIGVFTSHFKALNVPTSEVNGVMLLASVIAAALFPVVGTCSQKFGRRRTIATIGGLILTVGTIAMIIAVASVGTPLMWVASVILIVVAFSIWATITAFLTELFPTDIRATGYGVAYSLPSIVPAFYAYYMAWLGDIMPYQYTPAVITAIGGLLIVAGSLSIRDSRHKDLSEI